jgi:YebC/PmpR family DNA-binding regulatory protein
MSGHSHWATIRRKKEGADAKKGQIFTRLAREIVLAARTGGGDADSNVGLQFAISRARAQNMPKENIERAIKRGIGDDKDGISLEEVFYEGYAPHGIALIMECVTENRNRTVADIRHVLTRHGGIMGEAGSVSWQFKRVAVFPAQGHDPDKVFELAVEAGADDVIFEDDSIEIIGPVESFKAISDRLTLALIKPDEAGLRMIANSEIELSKADTIQILKLIEILEELDDVQNVYSTMRITAEAVAELES